MKGNISTKISIIIPTLNEEETIKTLLLYLHQTIQLGHEVLIVDGGSVDSTLSICKEFNVKILNAPRPGRASQMNFGANHSKNNILYFLHADVIPPPTFCTDIVNELQKSNAGWFSYKFDKNCLMLKFNASFTKRDGLFAGAGDQSLFIKKDVFEKLGKFDESFVIMEDFAFTRKMKKLKIKYSIVKNDCIVSSRKYSTNSYCRVNFANIVALTMFLTKQDSSKIKTAYKKLLNAY